MREKQGNGRSQSIFFMNTMRDFIDFMNQFFDRIPFEVIFFLPK
jgi:hypothetical protein